MCVCVHRCTHSGEGLCEHLSSVGEIGKSEQKALVVTDIFSSKLCFNKLSPLHCYLLPLHLLPFTAIPEPAHSDSDQYTEIRLKAEQSTNTRPAITI